MRPFSDGHPWGRNVAVDRSAIAKSDAFGRRDVAGHRTQHDHRLGKHLCFDLAIRPNRQGVLAQLDLPLYLAFDGQIFAAVQLSPKHDRFTNVHETPL